jgi:hypothetical protein
VRTEWEKSADYKLWCIWLFVSAILALCIVDRLEIDQLKQTQAQDRKDALHNKDTVERLFMGKGKKAAQTTTDERLARGELPGVRP